MREVGSDGADFGTLGAPSPPEPSAAWATVSAGGRGAPSGTWYHTRAWLSPAPLGQRERGWAGGGGPAGTVGSLVLSAFGPLAECAVPHTPAAPQTPHGPRGPVLPGRCGGEPCVASHTQFIVGVDLTGLSVPRWPNGILVPLLSRGMSLFLPSDLAWNTGSFSGGCQPSDWSDSVCSRGLQLRSADGGTCQRPSSSSGASSSP